MNKTSLSVVLTVHAEGARIQATARSLQLALTKARNAGLGVELIVVRETDDSITEKYLATTFTDLFRDHEVRFYKATPGVMGAARNLGVRQSSGDIVAVVEADHLVSEEVFTRGVKSIVDNRSQEALTVYHPEYTFAFGVDYWIRKSPDSDEPNFAKRPLIDDPIWPSFAIAPRDVFLKIPFLEGFPGEGGGPIHWQWNVDTLDKGIRHTPIPKTCLYQRLRGAQAMFDQYVNEGGLIDPSKLLRNDPTYEGVESGVLETVPNQQTLRKSIKKLVLAVAPKSERMRESYRFIKIGLKHAVTPTLRQREPITTGAILPEWLTKDQAVQYEFEHHVYPDAGKTAPIVTLPPSENAFTHEYWHTMNALPRTYEYVFIIPGITKGGAELVMMNYLNVIHQEKPDASVLLIAVEDRDPTLLAELPENVTFYQVRRQFFALPVHDRIKLLATIVRQLSPRVLHVVNTEDGFAVIERFGCAVAAGIKIYASLFGPNRFSDNRRTHVLLDNTAMAQYIQRIFTDNKKTAHEFTAWTGLPAELFVAHYQPLSGADKQTATEAESMDTDSGLRVLWAGRMDKEKRADIYERIAKAAKQKGLKAQFDAYGTAVVDITKKDETLIAESDAVNYRGPFQGGVRSIPGRYDVFILTSDFEGLPNALIEAASKGMVLIAPNVGGVSEVATPETGFLVSDNTDVGQYVDALESLQTDRVLLAKLYTGATKLVSERHTWDSFVDQVKNDPHYLQS